MSFKKKLYFTLAFAAVFYLIACIWMGWRQIVDAFLIFKWWLIPICLGLSFINYIVRFFKWHYYLRLLNIPLAPIVSFKVFLAGLVMSATPGKFGEVFKSYLVKEINRTPMSRSAPIVLAERLTDFIALMLMSLLGITYLPNGVTVFFISLAIVLMILLLVSWKTAAEKILAFIACLPIVGKHSDQFRMAYESIYCLVAFKPLVLTTLISIASWFCECIAFYLVLWGFSLSVPLVPATFIYAFATIMGALLMTPGGIGPTEGAMGGLLILLQSVPQALAASATLLIRICTLWFAVAVGLFVLSTCAKTFDTPAVDLSEKDIIPDTVQEKPTSS